MAKSKKVNKWDAAPENIGKLKHDLRFLLDKLEVRTYDVDDPDYKELVDEIFKGLDKALDEYNELEARHQKDTGMISEYEEENKNLKSKLDIMTDENDCLIDRVFNRDEEYTKLEAEHKKLQEAHLRLCDDCTKLATENDDLRQERDKYSELVRRFKELEKEKIDLEADIRDLEVQARVNANAASTFESELKQVIDLAKSYGLIIYDDRKDSMPDTVLSVGMCGHYYVLDEQTVNTTDYLRGRCNELTYRACKYSWAIKTMLKKATFSQGHIAEELRFMARKSTTPKDVCERWEGYADEFLGEHSKLVDKINRLEKKIEELSSQINSLKCGEIKWVLREGDC